MSNQLLEILFEDNHLLAVNKKAGTIVQEDETGDISLEQLVKKYLKDKYQKQGDAFIGVIHRIDRPVSGLVLFAKTSKALTRMNEIFRNGEVVKTYRAIVQNAPLPEKDKLIHYISRNTKTNKSYAHNTEVKDSKRAVLSYELIQKSDKYFLLEINLETGRHHQIRCQLAAIGCPIKGDLKYGASRSNKDGGICLHSYKLRFMHPVKKEMIDITAPVPDDPLWKFFSNTASK